MTTYYTSQSITGFNTNPPVDEGSETEANRGKWSTILDKIGTPLKNRQDAIDAELGNMSARMFMNGSVSKSTNYTVLVTDIGKVVLASNGITVTLPDPATAGNGFVMSVFNDGATAVTVAPDTGDTLNGVVDGTVTLAQFDSVLLRCTASVWNAFQIRSALLDEDNMASDSATAAASQQSVKAYVDASSPRSYLAGLGLSNGTDTTNDIDIAVGVASNSTNTSILSLAAATGKQLDVTWASGGTPGAPTGGLSSSLSIADGTYHVHLIVVSGVVEVGFDTSAVATNLIADHSATAFRRIGSILRESAAIVLFSQLGDEFLRLTGGAIITAVNQGTSAVLKTLTVPTGIQPLAIFNATLINVATTTGIICYFSSPDQTDQAASISATPLGELFVNYASTSDGGQFKIRTNTSAQIRSRLSASGADVTLRIAPVGWVDRRGRDD